MRKFLSLLALGLLLAIPILGNAQGNGNGNNGNCGNGNGNGGYSNNGYGQGNSPWANTDWPQWLITWLENGGQTPPLLAMDVIFEARTWGQQQFGLNYGQMLQKYAQGSLTLEYISTAPPTLTFRVRYGGGDISVIIDNL